MSGIIPQSINYKNPYTLHDHQYDGIMKNKANLNKLTQQITSKERASTYVDLVEIGGFEASLDARASIARIEGYQQSQTLHKSRIENTLASIEILYQIAIESRTLIMQKSNPTFAPQVKLALFAAQSLAMIGNELNKYSEGKYLFAGTKTDTPPVILPLENQKKNIDNSFTIPNANYYQGDNGVISFRANDNTVINYNVCANNPAIETLIASLFTAIEAEKQNDASLIEKSYDLINTAFTGLELIESKLKLTHQYIISLISQQDALITQSTNTLIKTTLLDDVSITAKLEDLTREIDHIEMQFFALNKISHLGLYKAMR